MIQFRNDNLTSIDKNRNYFAVKIMQNRKKYTPDKKM